MEFDEAPAVLLLQPSDESVLGRLGDELVAAAFQDTDLGKQGNKQFIDYVASYDNNSIGLIFSRGNGHMDDIKTALQAEIGRRIGHVDYARMSQAVYQKGDTAESLLERALKD